MACNDGSSCRAWLRQRSRTLISITLMILLLEELKRGFRRSWRQHKKAMILVITRLRFGRARRPQRHRTAGIAEFDADYRRLQGFLIIFRGKGGVLKAFSGSNCGVLHGRIGSNWRYKPRNFGAREIYPSGEFSRLSALAVLFECFVVLSCCWGIEQLLK